MTKTTLLVVIYILCSMLHFVWLDVSKVGIYLSALVKLAQKLWR